MPIIKSAKKRVKVAARANTRNTQTRRNLRDAVKAFNAAVVGGKPAEIAKTEKEAIRAIDIAAKKAVIHRNKAARKKAQIAKLAKSAGHKPGKAISAKPKTKNKKPVAKTKNTTSKTSSSRTKK